jgi:hypothetical protein
MALTRSGLAIALAAAALALASARWTLRAQDRPGAPGEARGPHPGVATPEAAVVPEGRGPRPSVQEALLRVYPLPFADETTLEAVAAHFRTALGAPVVLDLAALDRQDLTPEATVRLELEGVRLKTGLKLLLDKVGLTYRVIPEDNLLVLTDAQGGEDTSAQLLDELRDLHRDVHDLQDAVEELYQALDPEDEGGVTMPLPAIVRDAPADPHPTPAEAPRRSRPGL